ncbi:hypothetical protein AAG906_013174 [Vitis piasezkii]
MEYRGHNYDLDPLDTSVLVLQDRHMSHLVDSGQFSHPPIDSDDATLERIHMAAQRLDHDVADDLPTEGPVGVHHGLLDEDQGLQDEALLDEGLPADPLGCFMGARHGRLSCPSFGDISSTGDLENDTSISWIGKDDISMIGGHSMHNILPYELITSMVKIASRSVGPTLGALGDIHRIAIDILHVIGEEHHIHSVCQSPTSSYPSMRPPVSTTTIRMQPIQGRGRASRRDGGRVGR